VCPLFGGEEGLLVPTHKLAYGQTSPSRLVDSLYCLQLLRLLMSTMFGVEKGLATRVGGLASKGRGSGLLTLATAATNVHRVSSWGWLQGGGRDKQMQQQQTAGSHYV